MTTQLPFFTSAVRRRVEVVHARDDLEAVVQAVAHPSRERLPLLAAHLRRRAEQHRATVGDVERLALVAALVVEALARAGHRVRLARGDVAVVHAGADGERGAADHARRALEVERHDEAGQRLLAGLERLRRQLDEESADGVGRRLARRRLPGGLRRTGSAAAGERENQRGALHGRNLPRTRAS